MIKNYTNSTPKGKGQIYSNNYAERYLTYDLGCSSALVNSGFELISLDKSNPKKVQFIFQRKDGLEKIVDDYFANRLELKARGFFDDIKSIKNRIYSSE